MCYSSVQELQCVLFFCLGAANAQFFCSVAADCAILLNRSCIVCYSTVKELQGMLFFYSGISGFAILLFMICKV